MGQPLSKEMRTSPDLRLENRRLKRSVQALIRRIDDNQRIDTHFKEFESRLLAQSDLSAALDLLLVEALHHFGLSDIGLILVDRDYSLRALLENLQISHLGDRLQLRDNDDFSLDLYAGNHQVVLGSQDALTRGRLFPDLSGSASVALLPLIRNNALIGSLHLASDDPRRFTPDKAVDFLDYLASIVAVCLDNILAHEHLRYQSRIDMLTRVCNRMYFEEQYARELERSERAEEFLSCLFVDVDHFKVINDTYGHQSGDQCLRAVAAAIASELRKIDLLARYGGEEFVVILSRCNLEGAEVIAERIRAAVASLQIDAGELGDIEVTVSVGLSCWDASVERSLKLARVGHDLLYMADQALYDAKHAGRNCVVVREYIA